MKIGIISNLYPPYARGGAEHIAWRVAHELYARGHHVFAISTMPYTGLNSLFASIREHHVESVYRFFPLNAYYLLNDAHRLFPVRVLYHLVDMYGLHPVRQVHSVFAQEDPDVVLTHNLKGIGLQIVPEIRRHKLPHLHTLHDVQLSVPSGLMIHQKESQGLNRPTLRKLYEMQIKRIFRSPDTVISPSRFLSGLYRDRGFFPESRIEILPNPVSTIPHTNRSLGSFRGPLVLLFAGQLEEHKGVRFLLDSLMELKQDFVLHIAGEGTLAPFVSSWAARDRRVVYHGFVSLQNLNDLLAIVDVTVVPSLCYENSPTVIYESFGVGVPVIASDIGGIGELITNGENGYLFIPGDRKGFLSAVRTLAAKREEYWQKHAQIRRAIEPNSIVRYVDRLEFLMREAVARKQNDHKS